MGYGVRIVWSELGYAAICSGPFSMLARQIWLSSKWVYMVDCSPLLIVLSLERERNSRCFEDKERSISDLKLFFFRTLMDWLAVLQNQSFLSFLDFLDSCNFCS